MAYSCKILADSLSPAGVRLTTFEVTFPRIVLAEFNTHRMLSRNSASSRAIPVEKRIAAVDNDPFVPEQFGKNQPGMQASTTLDDSASARARQIWLDAAEDAATAAYALSAYGVHKQLANWLLEPFLWHTVIVSATEWSNFFALRCHQDAQPEIRRIAEMMRDAYEAGKPVEVDYGEWHLPLVPDLKELREVGYDDEQIARISAGRCARVSYLTHDGKRDPMADITLTARLQLAGHMSPFEHVAYPLVKGDRFEGNFRGWVQLRKMFRHEDDFSMALVKRRNEDDFSKALAQRAKESA